MNEPSFQFTFRLEDFDLSQLPISAEVLRADPDLLTQAISQYYVEFFTKLGGAANVAVADGAVHISWHAKTGGARDLIYGHALRLLKRGNYREAEPLLQSLHARFPDDQEVLFNYGMLLTEQGRADKACVLLDRLVELAPDHSHGWTALGVALVRSSNRKRAAEAFQTALRLDPDNAYALRNAAAILVEWNPAEALSLFEKAAGILPGDQQTLLGWGQCLMGLKRSDEADRVLRKCIEVNALTPVAEHARNALAQLAQSTMRSAVSGNLRPDAVMYCLSALRHFHAVGPDQARTITFEIAMLGRNGLNINDGTAKYTLKSLPGKFSGMHLVSYMYTGFKQIDPTLDSGLDLSREYNEARRLFDTGQDAAQ